MQSLFYALFNGINQHFETDAVQLSFGPKLNCVAPLQRYLQLPSLRQSGQKSKILKSEISYGARSNQKIEAF